MVILSLKASNAAHLSTAAGYDEVRPDFSADSNLALVAHAALGVLASASAILRLKLPNRELAAPNYKCVVATRQAALNLVSA